MNVPFQRGISQIVLHGNPRTFRRLYDFFGFRGLMKFIEIKLLGRYATTYCYYPPLMLNIEITNVCDMYCKYCYRINKELMNHDQGFMSYDDFVKVARQIKGVRRLFLDSGGEALMHKDLVRMLQFVHDNRIARSFGIVTNGMLLSPDTADKILATDISFIGISLDGSDAETHEKIRVGCTFGTIIENARYLAQAAGPETRVEVYSVLTHENLTSLESMPELVHDLDIHYFRTRQVAVKTHEAETLRVSEPVSIIQLLHEKCKKLGIEYRHYPEPPKSVCLEPFKGVGITWDGKISPCHTCHNIKTFGIQRNPYEYTGVWNGSKIRTWRRKMLQKKYPGICKTYCKIAEEQRIQNL